MAYHTNFFTVAAKDSFELGQQLGAHFKKELQAKMGAAIRDEQWHLELERAKRYLAATEVQFPQYVQEIKGYAEGAEVDFLELWAKSLGDEFDAYRDHCTSVVTNGGKLIAHNEDWDSSAADQLSVLQKTIGDLTVLELYYLNTLGGNSASINSRGYVQLINSLTHSDWQMGVPRNVTARFMSETDDPGRDFTRLSAVQRSTGYNHNLVSLQGQLWNIECAAGSQVLTQPPTPFVHTNHYLTGLETCEATSSGSTRNRFAAATRLVRPAMTDGELTQLMSNDADGPEMSIFNERTIGRMLIDLDKRVAKVWLRREAEKGWVEYPLGL